MRVVAFKNSVTAFESGKIRKIYITIKNKPKVTKDNNYYSRKRQRLYLKCSRNFYCLITRRKETED